MKNDMDGYFRYIISKAKIYPLNTEFELTDLLSEKERNDIGGSINGLGRLFADKKENELLKNGILIVCETTTTNHKRYKRIRRL